MTPYVSVGDAPLSLRRPISVSAHVPWLLPKLLVVFSAPNVEPMDGPVLVWWLDGYDPSSPTTFNSTYPPAQAVADNICPFDCAGKGECVDGVCQCYHGYTSGVCLNDDHYQV